MYDPSLLHEPVLRSMKIGQLSSQEFQADRIVLLQIAPAHCLSSFSLFIWFQIGTYLAPSFRNVPVGLELKFLDMELEMVLFHLNL